MIGAVANCKFLTVEKLSKIFSSENVCLKMPNLGLKPPICENFRGKVKC